MIFRTIGTFVLALAILVAAYLPQAQAITVNPTLVEYDLTITFTPPPNSSISGPPIFTDLTGAASFSVPFQFGETTINLVIGGFDIALIPGEPIFTGRFIPPNPISPVSFSFGGTSGRFPAFAFPGLIDLGTLVALSGPPILPLPIFDIAGPPIRVSGLIVGFDAPEAVGTWAITEQLAQTPLPAALPLFATGLGALGLLGWRRKRKASAAIAA